MNWLIIAPDVRNKNLKEVETFLEDVHGQVPFELFFATVPTAHELYDCFRQVMQATHCIILDSAHLSAKRDYVYIMGALAGKGIPTFVYKGGSYEQRYEILDTGSFGLCHSFDKLDDMLMDIESHFADYQAEDVQRQSLIHLFTRGLPFTSDCFAQYLAKDDTEICQMFLDAGMLVNARTSDGVPLLSVATRNECMDKVRWLVECGADINVISADRGYSPVMDAVWRKNYEMVKFFIDNGANLDFISSDGQPLMVLAVGNGNVRIVELLLEHGANPDIADSMGMSARAYANLFKKPGMVELMARYPQKS
ncbi:MAG: ankyrin repeat domain-containing protein [Treponema sp.]|nr:ankyrin repeat domain-containing protein [Treponema sp.]